MTTYIFDKDTNKKVLTAANSVIGALIYF